MSSHRDVQMEFPVYPVTHAFYVCLNVPYFLMYFKMYFIDICLHLISTCEFFYVSELFCTYEKWAETLLYVSSAIYPSADFISEEHLDFLHVLISWKSNLIGFYE